MGSKLDEPMRMAGGKKTMDIVGKRDVGSPRLRCIARLKSGQAMWIQYWSSIDDSNLYFASGTNDGCDAVLNMVWWLLAVAFISF